MAKKAAKTKSEPTPPTGERLPDTWSLGLAVFSCDGWKGKVYPQKAPQADRLIHYARRYRAVEGNSTFYALPTRKTIQAWLEKTYPGFGFSFKFPQPITHWKQLEDCEVETKTFLDLIEPLADADRLLPTMVQLSPHFGPDRLATLLRFVDAIPKKFGVSVEVRHPAFFDGGEAEQALERELSDRGIERVLLDSRCLFALPPHDDAEREARRKKPNLPVKIAPLTDRPIVRLICGYRVEESEPWLVEWADTLAHWIGKGMRPVFFMHSAGYVCEPEHATRLLQLLAERGVAPPALPADGGASAGGSATLF